MTVPAIGGVSSLAGLSLPTTPTVGGTSRAGFGNELAPAGPNQAGQESPANSLAVKAGIPDDAIAALAAGRRPRGLDAGAAVAAEFAFELMARQGVGDVTYAEAVACFGEAGTVELTALIGYFTMVCWVMNVARTPGPAGSRTPPLSGLPE